MLSLETTPSYLREYRLTNKCDNCYSKNGRQKTLLDIILILLLIHTTMKLHSNQKTLRQEKLFESGFLYRELQWSTGTTNFEEKLYQSDA